MNKINKLIKFYFLIAGTRALKKSNLTLNQKRQKISRLSIIPKLNIRNVQKFINNLKSNRLLTNKNLEMAARNYVKGIKRTINVLPVISTT